MAYIPYTQQAYIGWHNVFKFGTLTPSSETTDGPAENAVDGLTWDYWEFEGDTAGDTLEVAFFDATNRRVNYLAIAAHTLGSNELTIELEYSDDGVAWTPHAGPFAPENDGPHLWRFDPAGLHPFYRVKILGGGGRIGVLNAGLIMQLPEGIFVGHKPAPLNKRPEILVNKSERGQSLGRSVIRSGASVDVVQERVTQSWVRDDSVPGFAAFLEEQEERGFFFAWRHDDYPEEVIYGETDEQPEVEQGANGFMKVSFSMSGIVE